MTNDAPRRGAVDLGVVLMIVAFVVVGLFLYWLSVQVDREQATIAVQDSIAAAQDDAPQPTPGGTVVTVGDLQSRPDALLGQEVRLASLEVEATLGRQGFWVNPGPFLIAYSGDLVADSTAVEAGSTVNVTGTLRAMSDSVTTAWTESGTIGEGEAIAASVTSHYLEATRIQTAGGGAQ